MTPPDEYIELSYIQRNDIDVKNNTKRRGENVVTRIGANHRAVWWACSCRRVRAVMTGPCGNAGGAVMNFSYIRRDIGHDDGSDNRGGAGHGAGGGNDRDADHDVFL